MLEVIQPGCLLLEVTNRMLFHSCPSYELLVSIWSVLARMQNKIDLLFHPACLFLCSYIVHYSLATMPCVAICARQIPRAGLCFEQICKYLGPAEGDEKVKESTNHSISLTILILQMFRTTRSTSPLHFSLLYSHPELAEFKAQICYKLKSSP